jgi:hypothetical protein
MSMPLEDPVADRLLEQGVSTVGFLAQLTNVDLSKFDLTQRSPEANSVADCPLDPAC